MLKLTNKEINYLRELEAMAKMPNENIFIMTEEELEKIVGLLCQDLIRRAEEQLDITLKIRSSVKKLIAEAGNDRKYGARPLKRALQTKLEDPLTEAILNGEIKRGDLVEAGVSKKEIKFTVKETKN